MSGIVISIDFEREVSINGAPISGNHFEVDMLLNPDDSDLSANYGQMRLRLSGDASKIKDMKLSELEDWFKKAITDLLASAPQPYEG